MRSPITAVAACILVACGAAFTAQASAIPASSGAPTSDTIKPLGRTVQTFGDWIVTCDRALHCAAIGPDADQSAPGIYIYRDAGPEGQLGAMLNYAFDDSLQWASVTAHVGGRDFGAGSSTTANDRMSNVDGDAVLDLARALALGGLATLTRADQPPITVSTEGVAAALRWMDQKQGRTGTVTALAAAGDKSAAEVPAEPIIASSQPGPAFGQAGLNKPDLMQAVATRLRARTDVQACAALDGADGGVLGYRLSTSTELWSIGCNSGTMNSTRLFFLTGPSGSDPKPLVLPLTDEVVTEFYGAEYKPGQRVLSTWARDPGECGVRADWVWTGEAFVLRSENAFYGCWYLDPDMWPSTY